MDVDSGKGLYRCATQGALGFKQKWSRVREKMKMIVTLNRATSLRSGAKSRGSREESSQRHDVRTNVATFQREVKINVATLRFNVAMLRSNVATF